jgi:hypothetical protein
MQFDRHGCSVISFVSLEFFVNECTYVNITNNESKIIYLYHISCVVAYSVSC